jgi:HAD superfamily hydrolase (TIGR01549 family)
MSTTLAQLLARTRSLLLDFDGPVCAIFAGHPATGIVADLLDLVTAAGAPIPDPLASSRDPFDVLRYSATLDPDLARRVEHALPIAEVDATQTARPTPHAVEVIRAWRDAGRTLAIVSNNSADAVRTYLNAHGIDVDAVIARTDSDPALLKPSPHLVSRAIDTLRGAPSAAALLGDSTNDITAAHAAGIESIGYANKPGKYDALVDAGADVVIDDMTAILRTPALASA